MAINAVAAALRAPRRNADELSNVLQNRASRLAFI
jgi:hypothetical protein